MDKKLVKLIVSSIVFGLAKASHLQVKGGMEFKNPQIVPSPGGKKDEFGVLDPYNEGETYIFNISDVTIIY